ncbi:sugar nucleotide-binding protein [Endozoicomonas sp. SCSIO W0465]|uniref:SDR family oxidoreductase n=1 Tax=Endozoicomonas sp. SCSIO W0465 TaxID=2918516 RepID=UPI0020761006|nr:sugar nucleotide-binding protein [Endozoicomonas sp. SCSIO W0465]USE37941.1 NAD(P)-dependent oxidoreductase [Endozoicomonas sp. SCSIO W0465]
MKILLVGGTGLIGWEVQRLFLEKQITFIAPGRDELNLDNPESIDSCLKNHQPDIVVNCAGYNDPVKAENEPSKCFRINRDAMATLADCCHRQQAILVYISTYRVFDGSKKEAYTEKDIPNPSGVLATSRWQAEQQISERCPKHIILRLSWVISYRRTNLLKYLLDQISREQEVAVVADQQGCPTPSEDAARVIVAIIQQLGCGAEPWGTYHYAGAESISENRFAEAVIAEASQYQDLKIRKLRMDKLNDRNGIQAPANATLSCRKILSTFGVHNKPWRGTLSRMIRSYYEGNTTELTS